MTRFRWTCSVWFSRWRRSTRYLVALPFTYRNWWAVPLPKLGRSTVLELRNGTKYFVRAGSNDLAAVNETAIVNPYLAAPGIVLAADATVVDIGAYIGDFTMQAARACPRGRVIAVEPAGANVDMIVTQMSLNRITHVEPVHAAIGGAPGRVGVTSQGVSGRVDERGMRDASGGGAENVEMITLAQLLDRCRIGIVDLLKIDCEGSEWDILPAADPVLPRVRQIAMEFHCERGWTATALAAWLRARGFVVSHTGGAWNGLLWATRPGPASP